MYIPLDVDDIALTVVGILDRERETSTAVKKGGESYRGDCLLLGIWEEKCADFIVSSEMQTKQIKTIGRHSNFVGSLLLHS